MSNVINFANFARKPIAPVVAPVIEPPKPKIELEKLFTIEESPISDVNGVIPGRKSLIINKKSINQVSEKYGIVQPRDVAQTFEKISGLSIDKLKMNPNTGGMLIGATLENTRIDGDAHNISLCFYTGHNSQYRTILTMQALRIACENQIPAMMADKSKFLISEKHYGDFDFARMKSTIESLPARIAAFKEKYAALKDVHLTKSQFIDLFIEFNKTVESRRDEVAAHIGNVYTSARGQDSLSDGNAYKAFQAITFDLTHNTRKCKNELEHHFMRNTATAEKWFERLIAA